MKSLSMALADRLVAAGLARYSGSRYRAGDVRQYHKWRYHLIDDLPFDLVEIRTGLFDEPGYPGHRTENFYSLYASHKHIAQRDGLVNVHPSKCSHSTSPRIRSGDRRTFQNCHNQNRGTRQLNRHCVASCSISKQRDEVPQNEFRFSAEYSSLQLGIAHNRQLRRAA